MAFDLSARITADATGLVQGAAQGEKALEAVGRAGKRAGKDTDELTVSTGKAAKAVVDLAGVESRLDRIIAGIERNTSSASKGFGDMAVAMRAAGGASLNLNAAVEGGAAAFARAANAAAATAQAEARLAAATSVAERASASAALAALKLAQARDTAAHGLSAAEVAANRAAQAEARLSAAESNAERSAAAAALAALKLEQAQNKLSQGAKAATGNVNAQGYAVRNVGQQFGDFGLQVAGGASVARAFGQQAGQLGFALSELRSGPLSKLGAFLVGPWGIAFTIAAAFVAPLVEELFKAGEAAKTVELGSTGLGTAQGALGEIFDLVTGKIKKQNAELAASAELLRLNARLAAINLRTEAANEAVSSGKVFDKSGSVSAGDRAGQIGIGFLSGGLGGAVGAIAGSSAGQRNAGNLQTIINGVRSGRIKSEDALRAANKQDFTGTTTTREEFIGAIRDNLSSRAKNEIANLTDKSLNTGTLSSGLRNQGSGGRNSRAPKAPSTDARDEFGRDAADRLANIRDSLDNTPQLVASVNKQIRALDDLIDDLARKKPPGFEKLIADAKSLKPLVQDSLQKPLQDYLRDQNDSLAVQRLMTAGKIDEANALKTVQGLQRTMGPLTDEQKAAVLATTQAMRAEARALDDLRQRNAKYLEALGSIKGIVEDATQAFVRGDLGQIIKSPKKLLDAFQTLQGRAVFDKVFGGLFTELEDQVNGTSVVKDASDKMATAVDKASASILRLGNAADSAAGGVGGATGAALAGSSPAGQNDGATGPDIVVTARRFKTDPAGFFADALSKVGTKVAGVFTNPTTAAGIGKSIGKFAGAGLQGAATGSLIAGVGKSLGINLNKTGSTLGGGLGGILGSIGGISSALGPVGSLLSPALSIVGGLVGGLFKKTKSASAGLSFDNGSVSAGAASGTASRQAGASTLAGAVADGLSGIAQQLGAQITGSSNVKIGTYKDQIRVSTNGTPIGGKGSSGAITFKDESEAISYAIRDAINDGVFTGLSEAVKRALQSNSDVDKAVAEALKVQEVEKLIGGLGSALKAQFDAFDSTANERLRIARQYGLDVVAIEKLNAQQRTDLVDQTLKARIGSLSDFLQSIKFGDLFEGTASDRRAALQTEIAKVQKDAEAGKDGAADQLASLYSQLVSTSREAYGTAGGEFTTDRTNAVSAVEKVIQMETQRVNSAAGLTQATTDAVKLVASGVDETNDLLSQAVAGIRALGGAVTTSDTTYNAANSKATVRSVSLV